MAQLRAASGVRSAAEASCCSPHSFREGWGFRYSHDNSNGSEDLHWCTHHRHMLLMMSRRFVGAVAEAEVQVVGVAARAAAVAVVVARQ